MADDNVFAANPYGVQAGGGQTDKISQIIAQAAQHFAQATSYDPGDPPWGNDAIGNEFFKSYRNAHTELRDAVLGLATSVEKAGGLTLSSGLNFESAQSDNLDAIHSEAGRHM
ncbi:hypothetical protein ABZ379_43115 [Streptomyces canus]|uniref:hypothetical protein n=1 Tax=Streptomyces canus TaxID=58343 RepID=UPI0033D89032